MVGLVGDQDGFDKGIAAGLAIRHEHGNGSMSDDFQRVLAFSGITGSPSFVREPEGNGWPSGSSARSRRIRSG
jgi:hypothetical protein